MCVCVCVLFGPVKPELGVIPSGQENHSKAEHLNFPGRELNCNCKSRDNCPMNGLCNLNNVVYQAIIYPKENITDRKTYIGISSTKWKERYTNQIFFLPRTSKTPNSTI